MVDRPTMYLDQGLMIAGSGFMPFEPVVVSIDLGTLQYYDGGSKYLYPPTLGETDSNGGGAWTLKVDGPINGLRSVIGGGSGGLSNMDRLLEAGVVTILAEGLDGSKASWPVAVMAETPVVDVIAPPSIGTSLIVAAPVVQGGNVTVYGAGLQSKEAVSIVVIKGIGKGADYGVKGSVEASGVFERQGLGTTVSEETGAFMMSIPANLDPGIYTLEVVGVEGSFATAPLIVLAGPK
jgi:hypothetical protein